MQRWEYSVVTVQITSGRYNENREMQIYTMRTHELDDFLNQQGRQGWELINIQQIPFTTDDNKGFHYYFKRLRPPLAEEGRRILETMDK